MNAISFSLFGHDKTLSSAYPFASYIRGLTFNIKMAELIYPSWRCHCILDDETYEYFQPLFDYYVEGNKLNIDVVPYSELCMMMLTRVKPVFDERYDRVICRDVDSLITYKERQAVEYWIKTGRVIHAMTDSVSHNIALMGGMVGFCCKEFREIMKVDSFEKLVKLGRNIDYTKKGADQEFLNRVVLPKVQHTITEHYLLGMKQSFRGECYDYIQDVPPADIKPELAESNLLIEHLGSSGFRSDAALLFFEKHQTNEQKEFYRVIEEQFTNIHYWRLPL